MPFKNVLLARLTAGYLAQPVSEDLKMPWQLSRFNEQQPHTDDQHAKRQSPTNSAPLTINDLFELQKDTSRCTLCQQMTIKKTLPLLSDFVREYRQFMARWKERGSVTADLPSRQN